MPTKSQKQEFVGNTFARIAKDYDKLNDIMTFRLHRLWKRQLIEACELKSRKPKVLDICTGTGDIAYMWLDKSELYEVCGLDFSKEMLAVANSRLLEFAKKHPQKFYHGETKNPRVKFVQGDVLKLPFEDNCFDAVTVGFGLRNLSDLDAGIQEIKRVLKPGGRFASLDLGHPNSPIVDYLYKKFFLRLIPNLGKQFANDKDAYQYLVDSLKTWLDQKSLSDKLYKAKFSRSYFEDIMFGALAIVVAEK